MFVLTHHRRAIDSLDRLLIRLCIDEDQPLRVNARLVANPLFAPALELWP